MNGVFAPLLHTLPLAQRHLWPHLAGAAKLGFVLYGGTAVVLRLGHRTSVDFDFFSGLTLDRAAIAEALPRTVNATVLQDARDTLTFLLDGDNGTDETVKVSLFGMPRFGRVGCPDATDDGVLLVASMADLMATKLKVILQRAEARDYRDIAAMIRAGADLTHELAGARALFGPGFQPGEALKALVYFEDGDLRSLAADDKALLVKAASAVRELPTVSVVAQQPGL